MQKAIGKRIFNKIKKNVAFVENRCIIEFVGSKAKRENAYLREGDTKMTLNDLIKKLQEKKEKGLGESSITMFNEELGGDVEEIIIFFNTKENYENGANAEAISIEFSPFQVEKELGIENF